MAKKKQRDIEVSILLDRSGSMQSVRTSTVDGVNEYIHGLEKDVPVSLTQFDAPTKPEIIDSFVKKRAKGLELKMGDYNPRGMTPLLDAVGITVDRIKQRKSKRDQVVVIVTDGLENASVDWTRDRVKTLIEECRKAGWQFVFMGADIDAYAESGSLGMAEGSTYAYASTPVATAAAWGNVSNATRDYAGGITNSVDMPDEDTAK